MWELDCEEGWALKNWCVWTVVLKKILESPLDCKEIQPVHSKGDHSWVFFGRNDAEAETPVLWPPHEKYWLIGKDSMLGGTGGRRRRGRQRMRWLDGITNSMDAEFEWTPGVGDGQGGLACCDSWGRKESGMTEWLNWLTDWILISSLKALSSRKESSYTLGGNVNWCNHYEEQYRVSLKN